MKKLVLSLLTTTLLGLGAVQAHAGCQPVSLVSTNGSFDGTLCVSVTTNGPTLTTTLTLDGTAVVVSTGKTYTVDADATISGTLGNFVASGTVIISENGVVIKTITFNCPGTTSVGAAATFANSAITDAMSIRPPRILPPRPVAFSSVMED
jgi:hypothetical protein